MPAFLQGLVIGFSIAVPVGPIGLLCIRRSLADGHLAGFVSGLGAATADALYGVIAALGLTAVTRLLLEHQRVLQLGGGLFLLYLGLSTLRTRPTAAAHVAPAATLPFAHTSTPVLTLGIRVARIPLPSAYASTLVLTLANPLTILSFIGIFAGLGVGASATSPPSAIALVLGVFLGSAAWWLILSFTAATLGARLRHGGLRALNIASGLIIAAFGAWQLGKLL